MHPTRFELVVSILEEDYESYAFGHLAIDANYEKGQSRWPDGQSLAHLHAHVVHAAGTLI